MKRYKNISDRYVDGVPIGYVFDPIRIDEDNIHFIDEAGDRRERALEHYQQIYETCLQDTIPEQKQIGAAKDATADKKPDYSMIPKVVMDQLSYVMMAGALKYEKHNYTKGHNITQLTAAACRHLKLIENGEDIDKDTTDRLGQDIYHWACVMACGLMALHQQELGTLKDDRFKKLRG